jgi:two-component system, sensor histidine kinase LadS
VGWSSQIASGVEMLLLSLVLADRMHHMRRERDASQELATRLQNSLVDELRGSEQRLKQLVSQRVDELRRLIDMLSHEMRTPMSVIRMYLTMERPAPRSRELARQAVFDVDAIIERCLDTDQVEHGSVSVNLQPCRIDETVKAWVANHPEACRLLVSADQPCDIRTDLQLLKVVVFNLIDNALKYSPPDAEVRVMVQWAAQQSRPGVCVLVANPIGLAGSPDPDQVFRKFYRSPSAHGKIGSGLGLYLVRQFTELLGGSIDFKSDAKQVQFVLWLPSETGL